MQAADLGTLQEVQATELDGRDVCVCVFVYSRVTVCATVHTRVHGGGGVTQ